MLGPERGELCLRRVESVCRDGADDDMCRDGRRKNWEKIE